MALLKTKGLIVGVVGATGMVGRELLSLLERRRFPVAELLPFSSGLRRTKVRFKGRLLAVHSADRSSLERCDAIFFVSSDAVSASLAPGLARRGIWCLDDSSAFRPAPDVPLVIPEINASSLSPDRRLVAGPNCTVTGLAVAGYPLHRLAGVRRVRL
ncbi:MAG: aspartate-semialdehyde dehydrogenase, partial [Elusimicrobia bacterium]|nr:aspartate-semialdehyde dehydrogenase [Elusimicrobiota bacterium]